jgi:hypothetical protein
MDIDCDDEISLPDIGADEFDSAYAVVGMNNIYPNNAVSIYPTLSKGTITIEGRDIRQVIIMDINGQIRKIITCDWRKRTSIDISNETRGIYILKVITEKGMLVKKVILG